MEYRYGLSVFSVPLPSRKESCEIVLKPVSHTVKDLITFIKEEDRGVDRVAVYRDSKKMVPYLYILNHANKFCLQNTLDLASVILSHKVKVQGQGS